MIMAKHERPSQWIGLHIITLIGRRTIDEKQEKYQVDKDEDNSGLNPNV